LMLSVCPFLAGDLQSFLAAKGGEKGVWSCVMHFPVCFCSFDTLYRYQKSHSMDTEDIS
jgi:hypothetical protein